MKILTKNDNEIKKIRIASHSAAQVLEMIEEYIRPGINTDEINDICHNYIVNNQKSIPASLGYCGFPKSICTSINDVVCHGVPNKKKILKSGDIINVDVAIIKNGYYSDTSKMFIVGKPSILGKRLCDVTKKSLYLALQIIKPGIRLKLLGQIIQKYAESQGFSVVRKYCGHGIGKNFHEEPQVLHYDADDYGIILQSGMVFTVEPMINAGDYHVRHMKDGWTVKTKDRSFSAQYEHTVLVTNTGCEILTLRKNEIPNII